MKMREWLIRWLDRYRAEIRWAHPYPRHRPRFTSFISIVLLALSVTSPVWSTPDQVSDKPLLTNVGKYYWCGSRKVASMNIYHHPLRVVDIYTRKVTTVGALEEYVHLGCSHDSRWLIHQSIGFDPKRPQTMGVIYALDFETGKRLRLFSYPRPLYPYNVSFSSDSKSIFFTVTELRARDIAQRTNLPWRLVWFGRSLEADFPQIKEPVETQTWYVISWQSNSQGVIIHMQSDRYPGQKNPILLFSITSEHGPVEKRDLISKTPRVYSASQETWKVDDDRQLYIAEPRLTPSGMYSSFSIVRCNMGGSPLDCTSVFKLNPVQGELGNWDVVAVRSGASIYSQSLYGGKRSIPCSTLGMADLKAPMHRCIRLNGTPSPDWRWAIEKVRNGDIRVLPINDPRLKVKP